MKFVISTQELNYLISKIQCVVPQKPTKPVLTNLLIIAANDELTITATDLVVSICCNTDAKILEEGATTIPAKKLSQLVRELTAANIEFSSNSHHITTLIAGTSRFKLNGMSKEDYPLPPALTHEATFKIPQKDLKELLYHTSFAVSKEDNRYVLTGVLLQIANGQAVFVGTDGKRLARAHSSINVPADYSCQAVIPLKAVEEIFKNLDEEGDASVFIFPDKIMIQMNGTLLMTKLLIGEYPDIQRVIPENPNIILTLHREELITLLRQVSLFIPDNNHSVRFTFTDGELNLMANTRDIGEGQVGMPVNYQGDKLEIAFNPGYFIDILRHCSEETVTLRLIDPFNPGIITDGEPSGNLNEATPLYVIMPMRLTED